jgi:hypothetical protein
VTSRCEITRSAALQGCPAPVGRPKGLRYERPPLISQCARRTLWLCAVAFVVSLAASAQEGHPVVGTWYGDWGPTPQARHDVTVIMTWDGKAIGGTIDPGPDAVPFKTATLDSSTWTVHIEAERPAKGATAAVRYVIDGKLANLGSYNRTLSGTWTDGATKGDFKLTRD